MDIFNLAIGFILGLVSSALVTHRGQEVFGVSGRKKGSSTVTVDFPIKFVWEFVTNGNLMCGRNGYEVVVEKQRNYLSVEEGEAFSCKYLGCDHHVYIEELDNDTHHLIFGLKPETPEYEIKLYRDEDRTVIHASRYANLDAGVMQWLFRKYESRPESFIHSFGRFIPSKRVLAELTCSRISCYLSEFESREKNNESNVH